MNNGKFGFKNDDERCEPEQGAKKWLCPFDLYVLLSFPVKILSLEVFLVVSTPPDSEWKRCRPAKIKVGQL